MGGNLCHPTRRTTVGQEQRFNLEFDPVVDDDAVLLVLDLNFTSEEQQWNLSNQGRVRQRNPILFFLMMMMMMIVEVMIDDVCASMSVVMVKLSFFISMSGLKL